MILVVQLILGTVILLATAARSSAPTSTAVARRSTSSTSWLAISWRSTAAVLSKPSRSRYSAYEAATSNPSGSTACDAASWARWTVASVSVPSRTAPSTASVHVRNSSVAASVSMTPPAVTAMSGPSSAEICSSSARGASSGSPPPAATTAAYSSTTSTSPSVTT